MNARFFFPILILLTSCSTFNKKVVDCPNLSSPKKASEIIVNSNNNRPVYLGIRGVKLTCTMNKKNIAMEASINIRAIRNFTKDEDYAPVTLSIVSVDKNNKEFDRDEFSYSQFLLLGSKIVDRTTNMKLNVPLKGEVYFGIR